MQALWKANIIVKIWLRRFASEKLSIFHKTFPPFIHCHLWNFWCFFSLPFPPPRMDILHLLSHHLLENDKKIRNLIMKVSQEDDERRDIAEDDVIWGSGRGRQLCVVEKNALNTRIIENSLILEINEKFHNVYMTTRSYLSSEVREMAWLLSCLLVDSTINKHSTSSASSAKVRTCDYRMMVRKWGKCQEFSTSRNKVTWDERW